METSVTSQPMTSTPPIRSATKAPFTYSGRGIRPTRASFLTSAPGYGTVPRMSRLRSFRGVVARLLALTVLFSNIAVAAYVCPMVGANTPLVATDQTPEKCPDRDARQPNLCKAYCTANQQHAGHQSVDAPAVGLAQALPGQLWKVPDFSGTMGPVLARAAASQTTDPPATIRNCCFRL